MRKHHYMRVRASRAFEGEERFFTVGGLVMTLFVLGYLAAQAIL
jgi:hypothetical protein